MRVLLVMPLLGCLDPSATTKADCEAVVCAHVPECSPLTTGTWDLRTESACLDTFRCGDTPDACLDAVLALPCLGEPETWKEIEANTRALERVREWCR